MSNAIFLPPIIGGLIGTCVGVYVSVKHIIHPNNFDEGDDE